MDGESERDGGSTVDQRAKAAARAPIGASWCWG